MRTITPILALLALAAGCHAADFPVLDGDQMAVVVRPDEPVGEEARAAVEVRNYLRQSTGRQFEVMPEADHDSALPTIYVGRCRTTDAVLGDRLDALDRDAFIVRIEPDRVFLAGARHWSTYWAAGQFLRDVVGVRWLIPGDLGEDVPEHDRIIAEVGERTWSPAFLSRNWSGASSGGLWSLRQRIHERDAFHHNLVHIFDVEQHFDEHPEYFPLFGDTRFRPDPGDHGWQPCLTDPQGVHLAAQAAREFFAENPDAESFSAGINDRPGGWCDCPDCRALTEPGRSALDVTAERSTLYFRWLDRVAEQVRHDYPDRFLGCLAYKDARLPPSDTDLSPAIIPYLVSNYAAHVDEDFARRDRALTEWWGTTADRLGVYDYAYGVGFAIPRIYSGIFRDAMLHARESNVRGFYAEVYPNWGLDGPKLWVMARVLWDPTVDTDALTREWCERMFREAAAPMAEYFALCQDAWEDQPPVPGEEGTRLRHDPRQFAVFPPETIECCTLLLAQAERLAGSDLVRERIRFFRKSWDVTALLAGNWWASREAHALMERGASLEEMAPALRRMAEQIRVSDVESFLEETIGDDHIAFYHPKKRGWRVMAHLTSGPAEAKRWAAGQIAAAVIEDARDAGDFDASAIREGIDRRIREIFGEAGSESYRRTVGEIRTMALKVATVSAIDAPPAIDGTPDEAVWDQADVLSDFIVYGQSTPAEHATRVRLLHRGPDLYVALECEQDTSALVTEAAPRDGRTWDDDSVEIFINPGPEQLPYAQFIIGAGGAFFDLWARTREETYGDRRGVNVDAEWATQVRDDRWTAELRLPLNEIGCDPAQHPLLLADFVRNVQGEAGEISAWFPSTGSHADPQARGWLLME